MLIDISREYIVSLFEKLSIGKVSSIDFIEKLKSNGKYYKSAYIHFEKWYDNIPSNNFQEKVLSGSKEIRLVYDKPNYWIIAENKSKKHNPTNRKERININMEEITFSKMIEKMVEQIELKDGYYEMDYSK